MKRSGGRVTRLEADAVVVGSGVAGLAAAAGLAPGRVHLVTKAELLSGSASVWAQGGVAVALGRGDSPEQHAGDTVAAGAGLVEPGLAVLLAREGVTAIRHWIERGARFDRDERGEIELGREAAHGRHRIAHASGDKTGAELVRALGEHVLSLPSIRRFERTFATRLLTVGGRVVGVETLDAVGERVHHWAPRVVLATGGCGQVWRLTTNPGAATGDGLALAARAGAELIDLEFVQFHPTALAIAGLDPAPLLTEALRGEGALLLDDRGERFMPSEHAAAELAPRDVVARAIWRRLAAGRKVFLDARRAVGERFPERFPTVFEICRAAGLDPRVDPLPVAPAAHYHMGGIAVDAWGRASLPGLWACGEVAATGVHGANRLASNSLLEALVFGGRVAASAGEAAPAPRRAWPPAALSEPGSGAQAVAAFDPKGAAPELRAATRRIAWERIGLLRDGAGLRRALAELRELNGRLPTGASEARSLVTVAWLVAAAANERRESRGAQFRTDFPVPRSEWECRLLARPEISDEELAVRFERVGVADAPAVSAAAAW